MPVITLRFKDKKIQDFPLAIGQACTIGRKATNDIVIDNIAVSGSHASIDPVASTFVLRDLDSTNGTFVNKKKISMHNLRHGDIILIGKHELYFDLTDTLKTDGAGAQHELSDEDKTRVLDTSEYRSLMGKESEQAVSGKRGAMRDTKPGSNQEQLSFFKRLWRSLFG